MLVKYDSKDNPNTMQEIWQQIVKMLSKVQVECCFSFAIHPWDVAHRCDPTYLLALII